MNLLLIVFVGTVIGVHAGFVSQAYGRAWGLASWFTLLAVVVAASHFKGMA